MASAAPVLDPVVLRAEDGTALPLDPARWHADPTVEEEALLADGNVGIGGDPGRLRWFAHLARPPSGERRVAV